MKLHCLRPLPPPDPAPARPLPGIWLGGGGGFQPGNRPEARLSTSTPGGAPAPVAVPSAAPHGRLGEQLPPLSNESDRAVGAAGVRRPFWGLGWAHCPHRKRSHLPRRLPSPGWCWRGGGGGGGEAGRGEGTRHCAQDGRDPGHLQHQLPHPGQRRSRAPRVAAQKAATLDGSAGRPLVPNLRSEASKLVFRISPREASYLIEFQA